MITKELIKINNLSSVRYKFIERNILKLYSHYTISFPIEIRDIINIIKQTHNCRILSYQKFMELNSCSINDVVTLCESFSGCTHYDKLNNRYLILYNSSTTKNNVSGRILWTLTHELGHIINGHLPMVSSLTSQIAENGFNNLSNPIFESESDFFTATFLSPFQLFKPLKINSPSDIQDTFGLSVQASAFRWENYQKWKQNHIKTSFDNDILKTLKF